MHRLTLLIGLQIVSGLALVPSQAPAQVRLYEVVRTGAAIPIANVCVWSA